ncbi:MAG: hypothetical protein E6Q97_11655 [Desulfurellales bacterium]|nr:MAG: hypothetical protein E6Q97_11655 [Desulfurellales bacterium]
MYTKEDLEKYEHRFDKLDTVRLTAGFDNQVVVGVAKLSDSPELPNCIIVDGWTSAACLWEAIK